MTAGPTAVLDELVDERLGRHWDIRRQQDGDVITYTVATATGDRVELGQSYGLHLWLSLSQGWRSDTHGDDVESLVYEFNEYLDIIEAILRGQVIVPPRDPDSRMERWKVPDVDVVMRRYPKR